MGNLDHDPFADRPPAPPSTSQWVPDGVPVAPAAPGPQAYAPPGAQAYAPPGAQTYAAPGAQPYAPPGAQAYAPPGPQTYVAPGAQPYAAPGPSGQGWVAGSAPGWAPHGFAPAPAVAGGGPGPGPGPGEALHWVLPVGRSWQSVVAGYLGLFSMLVWVLAPFSIGVGIWALARARHGGHGRGRAITGIVGGLIGAALGIAVLTGAFR